MQILFELLLRQRIFSLATRVIKNPPNISHNISLGIIYLPGLDVFGVSKDQRNEHVPQSLKS
jgi:hypothetical protein